jgi:hypothetical protein
MLKTGKQMKLDLFKNYKIVTGTIDNKNPKSMYLTISAWGKPIVDGDINYSDVIRKMNKQIKTTLFDNLDGTLFDINKTIVDLDMRNSGISFDKKSYMNCEITLFKFNSFKIQNKKIKDCIKEITGDIILKVFDNSPHFEFHKSKK